MEGVVTAVGYSGVTIRMETKDWADINLKDKVEVSLLDEWSMIGRVRSLWTPHYIEVKAEGGIIPWQIIVGDKVTVRKI